MVRELFHEYRNTPGVDACVQSFADEIEGLPGEYAPPCGTLLVALIGEDSAGCVALRRLEPDICEMKRLYARPSARGRGVGRALVRTLIERARQLGYARMRLDTLHSMREAIALYEFFGFRSIAPYGPEPLRHGIHMELDLAVKRVDYDKLSATFDNRYAVHPFKGVAGALVQLVKSSNALAVMPCFSCNSRPEPSRG